MDERNSDGIWPHDQTLHAWWVEPGRLLAGEYPGSRTPEKAAVKLGLLLDAGVGSIVDLTSADDGLRPYVRQLRAAEEKAGRSVQYLSRPIPDMKVMSAAGYDRILDDIRAEIDDGRLVYVHCWKGIGRTGTVIGCRLIDDGLDYKTTIGRIGELRAGTRKAGVGCPQSSSQHHQLHTRARRS